jgi:hypothetical protein
MCPDGQDGQPSEEDYGENFHLWDLSGRVWELEVFNLSLTFITLLMTRGEREFRACWPLFLGVSWAF